MVPAFKASEEQVEESKAKPKAKTSAKAAAKPSAKSKAKATHPRSPQKPEQPSPNPSAPKRIRGKQSEANREATELDDLREAWDIVQAVMKCNCFLLFVIPAALLIAQCHSVSWEANRKMQEELAQLKGQSNGERALDLLKKFTTPPPKVAAPSPSPTRPAPKSSPAKPAASSSAPEPATEGARQARLRRVCEIKPSGRCNVPPEIHQKWKHGTKEEREALADELEASGWAKDSYHIISSSY